MEQKRQIINLTLQNLTLDEKKLSYDLIKPFDVILKSQNSHDWLRILGIVRTEIITLLLQDVGNEELRSLVRKTLIKEA